ncbi:hypothetical protein N665_0533s0015 [Sinapis alba]|nr:hypothetical protein N665_0533s0015 [Sinapis alba]
MVHKEKANQARSTLKKDEISKLPNDLTCQILSLLSTKEAVKTSVLSTRWRHLWLSLSTLELRSREFSDLKNFMSFSDRFFDSTRISCIQKVKLTIDKNDVDGEYIEFPNEATFETLVLCSPVLECLNIVVASDDEKVFRVHSGSLKWLTFERVSSFVFDSAGVVIDAPRLCFLSINNNISKSFIIHDFETTNCILKMSLLDFVRLEEIDDEFNDIYEEGVSSSRSNIHKFLHGTSIAKSMIISKGTFKLMCQYSKLEPLPQFGNMSFLDITLCLHDFKWLPAFLESFPNLKCLVLVMVCDDINDVLSEDVDQVSFSSVPECLLSSLKFVDLIAPVQYDIEMKLVKYLLKNSAVLKKLILLSLIIQEETIG